jgi:hypothetical protein
VFSVVSVILGIGAAAGANFCETCSISALRSAPNRLAAAASIMAASMRWDRNQKDFTAIESSLFIEDLMRLTCFPARTLQGALKTAQ